LFIEESSLFNLPVEEDKKDSVIRVGGGCSPVTVRALLVGKFDGVQGQVPAVKSK
jgi:hypothetical protein